MTHLRDGLTTSLLCLGLGGAVLIATCQFPETGQQGFGEGPGFYPDVLAISLLLMGGLSLWFTLRAHGRAAGQSTEDAPDRPKPRLWLVGAVLALCVAATLAMDQAGFFITGFGLVLGSALLIKPPQGLLDFMVRLVFTVAILATAWLVFDYFIGIQLPKSAWWS
jgi:hypothetical protein